MPSEQDGRRTRQCWNCNGELEQNRRTLNCLDCGSRYEIAPTGEMVKHRRTWWAIRVGYVAVLLGFVYGVVLTVLQSDWAWTAITIGLITVFCYREGPKIIEMVRHV